MMKQIFKTPKQKAKDAAEAFRRRIKYLQKIEKEERIKYIQNITSSGWNHLSFTDTIQDYM